MTVLENGKLPLCQQWSILCELEWRLEAEVRWQNQLICVATTAEGEMREVKDAANSLKDLMESLKRKTAEAKAAFGEQAARSIENAEKLKSAAVDLREANQTMEGLLGETGSNF